VKGDGRLGKIRSCTAQGDPCECLASPWPRSLPGLPRERISGKQLCRREGLGAIACLLEASPDADLDT
jgi:hypothetical protein